MSIAEDIARRVHADQSDKRGLPYIGHVERVVRSAVAIAQEYAPEIDTALLGSAAWLHDVVEDSAMSTDGLRTHGVSELVTDAVGALTKRTESVTKMQ